MQSEKFELTNQNEWEDFNIKLTKAMTVSYEQLLKIIWIPLLNLTNRNIQNFH